LSVEASAEQSEEMAKRKWNDLSPRTRRVIIVGATVDATLKIAALADLARRPSSQVRGSKAVWATAITVVNSAGLVPILYFIRGRRS
jgi:hypothetical protein